ncbi:MAG TPA: translation initiation factor IF-2 N-terminal domain-containing protein, partial [Mariprofundaceae bacterium]|nr:translation initiation factor IF-2 N-terminal domain-containing protein [Mariprofundaceae bacterium]
MSDIRILDLAKEMKLDVAEVLRAATSCGVAASGPTAKLDDNDRKKITVYLTRRDASVGKPDGKKTLTLNKPMVAGQPRGGNVEGRGHTVQVEVRRRRRPGQSAASEAAPAAEAAGAAVAAMRPAERAEKAME